MKAQYRTANGRLVIEVQTDEVRELFRLVAAVQDVFEAETVCGLCESQRLQNQVRTVSENDYFELICRDCHARFAFGLNKKGGGLFPKRRGPDGLLPNGGWARWVRREGE